MIVANSIVAIACSLCKSAVETSVEWQTIAQGLNLAILVLLIPPVIIFGAIFFAVFKSDKTENE